MKSMWAGMSLFTDQSNPLTGNSDADQPPLEIMMACLELAESAFNRYDKDGSDTLGYDEFVAWARSNRSFMLQVEQFRLVSEKATGFEEELSLPDGSDLDSDLEDEESSVLPATSHSTVGDLSNSLASQLCESHPHTSINLHSNKSLMPPPFNLELSWVYGTNGPRTRNNCRFLSSGEVVYTVANYAVVYSSECHEQRYYCRHKRFIQCLDVNESGEIVATADGDAGNNVCGGPEIHVWSGKTLECLAILSNFHEQGVSLVAFPAPKSAATSTIHNAHAQPIGSGSSSSMPSSHLNKKTHRHAETLLATIGTDANASMALWNWQQEAVVASGRALTSAVSSSSKCKRKPFTMALSEDGDEIVVCGTHFVLFHQIDGRFFKQKKPQLIGSTEQERASPLLHSLPDCLSVVYYGVLDVIVGTSRGELLRFQRRKLTQVVQAHEPKHSVTTAILSYRSMILFTGGKDGQIKQWDSTLRPIGNPIDLHTCFIVSSQLSQCPREQQTAVALQNEDFRVSSLAYDPRRHRFLIATRQGNIIEFSDEAVSAIGGSIQRHIVASGHSGRTVSGAATAHLGSLFASFDTKSKLIKLWCLRRRICTSQLRLTTFSPVSLAFSNSCDLLAIGGNEGSLMLARIRNKSLVHLKTMKNTSAEVTVIKFAPDDQIVAVGRTNGLIYLYRVDAGATTAKLTRYALLKPRDNEDETTASISSLEFTADGSALRTEDNKERYNFWDLRHQACTQVPPLSLLARSAKWITETKNLGKGVRATSSYSKKLLLATNAENGDISLCGYPWHSQALSKTIQFAHLVGTLEAGGNETVTSRQLCVGKFALRDTFAITCSRHSAVICQWRIEEETKDPQPRPHFVHSEHLLLKVQPLGLDDLYFSLSGDEPPREAVFANDNKLLSISASIPTIYSEAPDLDLTLSHTIGINCDRSTLNRVVAPLGTSGKIVYAAGSLVISRQLQVGRTWKQTASPSSLMYAISCVASHRSKPVIALGSREDGRALFFTVGDEGFGLRQISAISSDEQKFGKTIVTMTFLNDTSARSNGNELDLIAVVWKNRTHLHSIGIYAWKKQPPALIASAQMTALPVLFCEFVVGSNRFQGLVADPVISFVTGGVNHVTFWRLNTATGHIHSQQGVFGHHALNQTMLCAVPVGAFVLTGAEDGSLVVWKDGMASHMYKSPSASVPVQSSNTKGILGLEMLRSLSRVVGITQHGVVMEWELLGDISNDGQNTKGSSLLQLVRTQSIADLPWKLPSDKTANPGIDNRQQLIRVTSFCIIDETNDALIVLASGQVIRVELDLRGNDRASLISDLSVQIDTIPDIVSISLHPRQPLIAVCSSAGKVCVWNLQSDSLEYARAGIGIGAAHTIVWSSLGTRLAISFTNGGVHVLNGSNLEEILDSFTCEASTPMSPYRETVAHYASILKYSPTTTDVSKPCLLAVASTDMKIYVYSSSPEQISSTDDKLSHTLIHTFVGHSSFVHAMDFSVDIKWLQSASNARHRQLLRWPLDSQNGQNAILTEQNGAIECGLTDDKWATWTASFSGPVVGLEELRSHSTAAVSRINGELGADQTTWHSRLPTMAVGTDSGKLMLSWYPFGAEAATSSLTKEYLAYFPVDASVSHIEFSSDNTLLSTLGQSCDGRGVVLVWKTDYEDELRQLKRLQNDCGATNNESESTAAKHTVEELSDLFKMENSEAKGDEFLAVRPWAGAIREPSDYISSGSASFPDQELHLEFVYGVNMCATASTCAFFADDTWEIVYTSASIGIVYNTKTQTQLLHQGHGLNAISALSVHPRGDLVVTGECGVGQKESPRIIIWDANSASTVAQVTTVHTRGILLLAFSPNGQWFASVGMEDDHVLAIYSLNDYRETQGRNSTSGTLQVQLVARAKTSKQRVWGLSLSDDGEAASCGDQHLLFYQHQGLQGGRSAMSYVTASVKRALFSSHKSCSARASVLQVVHVFKPQTVISSQSDGSLYLWKERKCVGVKLKAHEGAIPALTVDRKHQLVLSGGRDGKVCVWSAQLEGMRVIDLAQLAGSATTSPPLTSTRIQSLAVRNDRILVVTTGSEICELIKATDDGWKPASGSSATNSNEYRLVPHQRGHATGELWGLAAHPTKLQFATAGDDGTVRLWDAPTRSLLSLHQVESLVAPSNSKQDVQLRRQLRALAFSSDGGHLAVGISDGCVLVLSSTCDGVAAEWRGGPHGVRSLKYSPDGAVLAVGSQDRRVHLLDALTYRKVGELRGHSAAVTHMDFSKDGGVLQTVSSGAGELLFWDVRSKSQITSASVVRDAKWETWSCPFGWPVQGIYPPESDGSDVNAVSRTRDERVVASGNDNGSVRLLKFPSVTAGAPARSYAGHASHVTNCVFSSADAFLLTTGGRDQTICQFRLVSAGTR